MDAVCVVPENAEIRSLGAQRGKPTYYGVAEYDSGRVLEFRHTPNAFYALVAGHQCFNHIHIRPIFAQGHGNQLEPKVLCHGKMPVIAWNRAQKFPIRDLYPRRSTHKSVQHSVAENEVHQCQAAVSAYQYVLPLNAQQLCHQTFGFWNAVQATIISAIHTAFTVSN